MVHRRPGVEHQRLSHVRSLARAVRVDDHHGASPYAVVSELDDSGLNSAGYLADPVRAVQRQP